MIIATGQIETVRDRAVSTFWKASDLKMELFLFYVLWFGGIAMGWYLRGYLGRMGRVRSAYGKKRCTRSNPVPAEISLAGDL